MKEECAIFGIFGNPDAAKLTYLGLYSLQHRGQESTGIITSDGNEMFEHKSMGLVSEVFSDDIINSLRGNLAVGHNRYSTAGESRLSNAQPFMVNCKVGQIAIAHNGNLVNADKLKKEMEEDGSIFRSTMDSEIVLHLIAKSKKKTLNEIVADALCKIEGAYSIVFLLKDRIIAAKDPLGFRPLCMGKLDDAYVFASESCAFDLLRADYIREIEPGEMCVVTKEGLESINFSKPAKHTAKCIFEFIYFSRPDSRIFGENVDKVRRKLGRKLSEEAPVDADMVISVPDSSNTIALGYANESGIPFEIGLIRNHYVGRTFIKPKQSSRDWNVRIKFNPVSGVLKGKKVIVVDDSIVRGSTMKKLVSMLREAGAAEIHLRIGSPMVKHSCYFGIDTPTSDELIATSYSVEQARIFLGADSLKHISLEGLKSCVKDPDGYCVACFNGDYPIDCAGCYKNDKGIDKSEAADKSGLKGL